MSVKSLPGTRKDARKWPLRKWTPFCKCISRLKSDTSPLKKVIEIHFRLRRNIQWRVPDYLLRCGRDEIIIFILLFLFYNNAYSFIYIYIHIYMQISFPVTDVCVGIYVNICIQSTINDKFPSDCCWFPRQNVGECWLKLTLILYRVHNARH